MLKPGCCGLNASGGAQYLQVYETRLWPCSGLSTQLSANHCQVILYIFCNIPLGGMAKEKMKHGAEKEGTGNKA